MMVIVVERTPGASGVNVTEMVQAEFAESGVAHVGLVELKSLAFAPAMAMLEM